MIWVTFAVPFESAAFRRRPASRAVRILHTGVGSDAARIAIEQALCNAEELPERVLVSGFAGALIPELSIGEIVIGEGIRGSWRRVHFAQSDKVLATADAKRVFRERTGADVVDMETDAIQEACATAGVPALPIRAISDGANEDLGLPPDLLEDLSTHPLKSAPRLVATLCTNGARRKAFLELIRNCRQAQCALANALEQELTLHGVVENPNASTG
jgi:nucleoside phosphorylase